MTNRDRFRAYLNGEKVDRMPVMEWASYWDLTLKAWEMEDKSSWEVFDHFGLDKFIQFWPWSRAAECPSPKSHGAGILQTKADYDELKDKIYSEQSIEWFMDIMVKPAVDGHNAGDFPIWFTLPGFFWHPRELFGIENHLFAFYDEPELMHEINQDHVNWRKKWLSALYEYVCPEFMTFAEDMSYNNGPMLSKTQFDEFLVPYYNQIIPIIKSHGTKVFIDTDGNVEPLIPWFEEVGIEGILPLERQAGVDVNRIRKNHPNLIMIGAFDKTIMHLGEAAMRKEFERILPAIQSGRYIASVDHQTPPDVSKENYQIYVNLLKEYAQKA